MMSGGVVMMLHKPATVIFGLLEIQEQKVQGHLCLKGHEGVCPLHAERVEVLRFHL